MGGFVLKGGRGGVMAGRDCCCCRVRACKHMRAVAGVCAPSLAVQSRIVCPGELNLSLSACLSSTLFQPSSSALDERQNLLLLGTLRGWVHNQPPQPQGLGSTASVVPRVNGLS